MKTCSLCFRNNYNNNTRTHANNVNNRYNTRLTTESEMTIINYGNSNNYRKFVVKNKRKPSYQPQNKYTQQ